MQNQDLHSNHTSSDMLQRAPHAASAATERRLSNVNCPRCESSNTKFCYYNNYSKSQPRYFCKNCRRYWTNGGALRNVPVGGGCRKNKRSKLFIVDRSASNFLPSSQISDNSSVITSALGFSSSNGSSAISTPDNHLLGYRSTSFVNTVPDIPHLADSFQLSSPAMLHPNGTTVQAEFLSVSAAPALQLPGESSSFAGGVDGMQVPGLLAYALPSAHDSRCLSKCDGMENMPMVIRRSSNTHDDSIDPSFGNAGVIPKVDFNFLSSLQAEKTMRIHDLHNWANNGVNTPIDRQALITETAFNLPINSKILEQDVAVYPTDMGGHIGRPSFG